MPITYLLLALLSLSANAEPRQANEIFLASDIPQAQQAILSEDLESIPKLYFTEQDPEAVTILGLTELSGAALQEWLSARVQYLVGDSFRLDDSVFYSPNSLKYENPDEFPPEEKPELPSANAPKYTVAQNIGLSIYVFGKRQGQLLQADIMGRDLLEVRSPRTGIVKIGEGMFKPLLGRYGWMEEGISTEISRFIRIGALFHEGRHSDGHGPSLGFVHATCPPGHDYAGRVVCDRSLNGAYVVGALVERNLLKQCVNCSVAEREAFRLYTLDAFNRVIKDGPTGFLDATPEGKR